MIAGRARERLRTLQPMPRLTLRDILMPAATVVIVTTVFGLILFGTRALPVLGLSIAAILGGIALLLRYAACR